MRRASSERSAMPTSLPAVQSSPPSAAVSTSTSRSRCAQKSVRHCDNDLHTHSSLVHRPYSTQGRRRGAACVVCMSSSHEGGLKSTL
jgi:hypothetical protein